MDIFRQFAESSGTPDESLTGMLGIDWKMLIFQIVAFLIMLFLLSKFVYPWLIKSVDERQKKIEIGAKAAAEAQDKALEAEKRISKLMSEARTEANEIVAAAKAEATETLNETEEKSRQLADRIASSAQKQIDKDVLAAKKALRGEMVELVALATEKVAGKVVSNKISNELITDAVKDAE
ncbi:MAG: F0F1 ATP synthase subunit B [Candidatus Saccharimonadales bacterium]